MTAMIIFCEASFVSSMKSDKGMWEKGILSVESFFVLDALGIASETHRPPVSLVWHPVSEQWDGIALPIAIQLATCILFLC